MKREIYVSYDRLSDIWRSHVFLQNVRALFRPRIKWQLLIGRIAKELLQKFILAWQIP